MFLNIKRVNSLYVRGVPLVFVSFHEVVSICNWSIGEHEVSTISPKGKLKSQPDLIIISPSFFCIDSIACSFIVRK